MSFSDLENQSTEIVHALAEEEEVEARKKRRYLEKRRRARERRIFKDNGIDHYGHVEFPLSVDYTVTGPQKAPAHRSKEELEAAGMWTEERAEKRKTKARKQAAKRSLERMLKKIIP